MANTVFVNKCGVVNLIPSRVHDTGTGTGGGSVGATTDHAGHEKTPVATLPVNTSLAASHAPPGRKYLLLPIHKTKYNKTQINNEQRK